MSEDEAISIHSGDSDGELYVDRRAILEPVIRRVVDALGGYENGVYTLGHEVTGCLRDLKKLWRKDDTDDERTVARIFWETRVLSNDLVPILMTTAGKGLVEDKRAVLCAVLMTAMTWPIDMAEELKELDEELDKGTDYTQLQQSHLNYKAALLKPGVIQALFGIALAPLAKHPKQRTERDGQVINIVLHLIRNLAFIKDLPLNLNLSADQVGYASLQTKLIRVLSDTHVMELLLTIASNTAKDPLMTGWNTLVLEIFYLLLRGVQPVSLAMDQAQQPKENLHRLLGMEQRLKREYARNATSRHSRFGTTISVKLNTKPKEQSDGADAEPAAPAPSKQPIVLHRQQAITSEAGSIMDLLKRQGAKKGKKIDELARDDNLSLEAKLVLQHVAKEFLQSCFNPFLASVLKDIKSERPKITEKDHLRLLYVTKWFVAFFLALRSKEKAQAGEDKWGLGLIAEVTESGWIVWVLKRLREAMDEKPKLWTEFQAGIECLTQLLLLIENMSTSQILDPVLNEAAEVFQQRLIYNGEVLDLAFESLRTYKEGTQSLTYLESSVHLAYALLRMLERWGKSKSGEMYVRKKKINRKKKTRGNANSEENGVPDIEEEEEEEEEEEVEKVIHETMFTFEAFQMKFANAEIAHTLITYLARYKEFKSPEEARRVVSLLHRQAVKAKAEGLFFQVSSLELFKTILAEQKSLPNEQPYKDLVNLINFILRQFFKALSEDPFVAIEAFFPKNRGRWKQHSSWEPEERLKRTETVEDKGIPPDVRVKKGFSWSEQLGIAVAAILEEGKASLIDWLKEVLQLVISQRQKIIDDTDDTEEYNVPGDADDLEARAKLAGPSNTALELFADCLIPYVSNEHAEAATKNPRLKLLFRLAKFAVVQEDAEELQWSVPASILPSDLQGTLNVINEYLETPFDLGGKKASQLLSKSSRRRRRRRRSLSPSSDEGALSEGDEGKKAGTWKKEKRKKEKEHYKSADVIADDSDEEMGDIEAFLEKEKALREKTARAAATDDKTTGTMRATGTKKRRRGGQKGGKEKKRKGERQVALTDPLHSDEQSDRDDGGSLETIMTNDAASSEQSRPQPKPRPKPRPIHRSSSPPEESLPSQQPIIDDIPPEDLEDTIPDGRHRSEPPLDPVRRRSRVVTSDEED